jgi:uncharacterized protein involved in response to NO
MPSNPSPVWQIAFRPFFLAASVFITLAFALWALVLSNSLPDSLSDYQPYGGWFNWHSHEMIFGFVQAVAIGFLLTASRNWAGQAGISSNFIKLLMLSWVLARFSWLIPGCPTFLIIALDVLTPALAALGLGQTLAGGEKDHGKGSQSHNWPFVGLLSIFALVQLIFHSLLLTQPQYLSLVMQAAVMMMAAMTLWVSGRVLPFFTRARLQTPAPLIPQRLVQISMGTSWLLIPCVIASLLFPQQDVLRILTACVALIAVISQSYRLSLFYQKGVFSEPMLWSLYCAFAWIIVGFLMIAISMITETTLPWLHAITVGGLLTMIISMMARISLGHTGRPILALRGIPAVFIALQIAALLRITLQSTEGYLLAIILLLLSMMIFLSHYSPILLKTRSDGKPG